MKRKLTTLTVSFVAALVTAAPSAYSQTAAPSISRIEVGEDRVITSGDSGGPFTEPHLAVNPRNPKHMVVGTIMAVKPDLSATTCAVFTSVDGGHTWTRHQFDFQQCYDPWVAITDKGTAIFTALDISKTAGGLRVYRSADGGQTWPDKFLSLGKGHDHQTLVQDTTNGKFGGNIYLVSSLYTVDEAKNARSRIFVARSSDDGATLQEQSRMLPSNLNLQAANAGVLSDGTLVIGFGDHHRMTGGPRLIRPRDWLLVSKDGGRTISEPLLITEIGGGMGWPMLAVRAPANSAPERILWLTGGDTKDKVVGVFVQYTDDRGERWSERLRVDQGNTSNADAQIPMIAVNKDGVVAVAWFDRRNHADRKCYDLFFAASLDGGKTFQPEVRVSRRSSCSDAPANKGAEQRWPYGGDYYGFVAAPDGTFSLVWPDSRDGVFRLWTANVKVPVAFVP